MTRGLWIASLALLLLTGGLLGNLAYGQVQRQKPRPAPSPASGRWILRKSVSKMDDSTTITLTLHANQPITGWPNRVVTPSLILRCQEGEIAAYVVTGMAPQVEEGDNTSVLIRLDKEDALTLLTSKSTDSQALFFDEPAQLIEAILEHRSLRFRFVPFNSSPQETTFDIHGLGAVIKPLQVACGWDPEKDRRDARELELKTINERTERLLNSTISADRRALAAYDLGLMASPSIKLAVPALIKALKDPADNVRVQAAIALGNIGPAASDAIAELEAAAAEPASGMAPQAKRALEKIRGN